MEKTKLGIIGAGKIGRMHLDNLLQIAEAEIHAIADLYIDKMDDVRENYQPHYVTKDYMDILNDPEIDAILICTVTNMHTNIILEAAKAKKHVFCEKPISFDLAETIKVLGAVNEAGIKLQVGFNRRFDHNFSRAHELYKEEKIGTPHTIRITSRDPAPPPAEYVKHSGGLPFDMTIHDFDMVRFLTGSEVKEVYVQGSVLVDDFFKEYGDIDTAVYTLKFENGAIGIIENSRKAAYGYDQRAEIFGSKGSIQTENDYHNTAVLSTNEGIISDKPKYFYRERYEASFKEEIKKFVECIANNTDVYVNGNDGLQAELIAHAAVKSLKENRPIKTKEILDMYTK